MEKIEKLNKAFCDVRKAHRIIYEYQQRMLDLIRVIAAKLDFSSCNIGNKYFSNPIYRKRDGWLEICDGMWAWDFLYSYVFEYYLGEIGCDDDSSVALSIVQYSDTGYFDIAESNRQRTDTFASEEESATKLLFIIECKPKKKEWVWDIEEIVNNKEFAGKNHTHTVLEKKGCRQGLYSFPLERFVDEKSMMQALQEFCDFCKEHDIVELELV